jgi:PhzF family phenazine biosynthesis protein
VDIVKYVIVDAFSSEAFGGNPAAVCLQSGVLSDSHMQDVAAEFNLSETAYVARRDDGRWDLRWFTPAIEVNLCGHATLATAHAMWNEWSVEEDCLRFVTRSGELTATRRNGIISLVFPITITKDYAEQGSEYRGFSKLIGTSPVAVSQAGEDCLVQLNSAEAVRVFKPDLKELAKLPVRGLIVTAVSDDCDFVSRFFAPSAGIDEDPVTGSAHCALAHFWSSRLLRRTFTAKQISARGGELQVAIEGGDTTVILRGQAVSTMRGELLV